MLQILTCRMDIAETYGLDAAVFLHNIVYWTLKNKAEDKHFHEGRFWTYATRKGLAKMYPLWSESQIRRLTDKLRDQGALLVGDFNEDRMQRTIWYAPSDEILSLYSDQGSVQSRQMHLPISSNASDDSGKCLYKENKKNLQEEPPIVPQGTDAQMLFDRFWAAYPKKKDKERARKAWKKLKPDLDLCRVMAEALERQKRSDQWTRDGGAYIPHPSTWLNGRRWEDEPDKPPDLGPAAYNEEGYDGI